MTEAVQTSLIVASASVLASLIGSGAMIAITLIKARTQARHHQVHEDVSAATNRAIGRLEIAVNGDLDERIKAAVKAAME